MNEYRGVFVDASGREATPIFHAANDNDAAILCNAMAGQSDASWVGLQKVEDLTVDSGTYSAFKASGKPTSDSTVRSQGNLFFEVSNPRDLVKVTIPAVQESLLSSLIKTIGTDPISGVGKVFDVAGNATTAFKRGKFKWAHRKGK